MTRKTGFTLIELLVVIAIIAILAAIIFPVFLRAKEASYRSGDLSNMNAIRSALQLYRADQEAYPPQILGYASFYDPGLTQLIPANQLHAALYPRRIASLDTMRPAYDRIDPKLTDATAITVAAWPHPDSRIVPNAPILDLNGDGVIDNNDDIGNARQAYGPNLCYCNDPTKPSCMNGGQLTFGTAVVADAAQFYKISGYDVADVKTNGAAACGQLPAVQDKWELHYTLQWTSFAIGGGNREDDPRQLIYSEPPDNTVVTWNSWFRDYDANNVTLHEKKDFVLFLNGGARPFDSANLSDRSWRVTP